ncbi:MAG: adenylosuccinate synthetase, partial [Planctomycetota bacterium]
GFGEEITGVRTYDDLPDPARQYVERIESVVGVPVRTIGVGPDREQTIERRATAIAGGLA